MRQLRWEAAAAMIGFGITLVFIWVPGPYAMGAFTFIAQPLFLVAGLGYLAKVLRDLRQRDVL